MEGIFSHDLRAIASAWDAPDRCTALGSRLLEAGTLELMGKLFSDSDTAVSGAPFK